jgi:hypothetical protein
MRYVAAFVGFAALVLVVGSLIASSVASPSPLDYTRQDAEIARLERDTARAEFLNPLDTLLAVGWRVVPLVAVGLGLAYLAALGAAHAVRRAVERVPDGRGLLPVPVDMLPMVAPVALGSFHAARQLEASRSLAVPHTITYAPHVNRAEEAQRGAVDAVDSTPLAVPSFAELLQLGKVGRNNPLCLGFDDAGVSVDGSWLDLYSCGVGGLAGSGKTWTAVFLASQAALFGTRFVVLDPHAGDENSLAQRLAPLAGAYVCGVASAPADMRASVKLVAGELARRKVNGRGEPWLFVADEYSALQRGELAGELAELVEGLGQEGRKLGLYGLLCGQVWSAARSGGTETRDSLASAYIHRLRPSQARMLSGLTASELPADVLQLPAGCAYLLDTAGNLRRVTVPVMSPGDVVQVANLLAGGTVGATSKPTTTGRRSMGFRAAREVAREVVVGESLPDRQDAANWTPEEARILALLQAGKTPGEVAQELAGGVKGGRAYTEAARAVAVVVARLAKGVRS